MVNSKMVNTMMKTYIIPQTNLLYCERLMATDQPSIHGDYQYGEQLSPARKLYI